MSPTPATDKCGARNRQGKPCGRVAGWGTDHLGYGRCRQHLGNTRTGRQYGAKLRAQAEAARLGAEVPLDAADALTLAVRLVGGEVAFLRAEIRKLEDADEDADLRPIAAALAGSIERLARIGKLGTDAKIDERRLELDALVLDRLGGAVALAITDAALDEDSRARLDAALRNRLGELSDDDLRPGRPELVA